jgi:hypothetical protein
LASVFRLVMRHPTAFHECVARRLGEIGTAHRR